MNLAGAAGLPLSRPVTVRPHARVRGPSSALGSVVARRAEGCPDVHIPGAADELLKFLLDTEENVLSEDSILMALARVGAQAIMARAELEGSADTRAD